MEIATAPNPVFVAMAKNPVRFRMFLLKKLPAAYFAGLRMKHLSEDSCSVTIPFKWLTQNPFRSIYYACMGMAAELTTGALAMALIYGRKPPVSMLLTGVRAEFYKKATGLITFTCDEGQKIREAIEEAVQTHQPQQIIVRVAGENTEGVLISEFWFTWSYKTKAS